MKNKIISSCILLCVIVCTVIVYQLLFDQHNTLFYINVVIACIVEIILFFNIPILSNKRLLTFRKAASTILLNIYVLFLFIWTSIFSLYIEEESNYRILYIGLLVATVIFSLLLGSVELGGNIMQKEEKLLEQSGQEKNEFRSYIEMYRLDITDLMVNVSSELQENNFFLLETVLDKISIFPSEKIKQDVVVNIKEKLDDIKYLYEELQNTTHQEDLHSQISQKIKHLNNYINILKLTL